MIETIAKILNKFYDCTYYTYTGSVLLKDRNGVYWFLWDNGGEYGLQKVNDADGVFYPASAFGFNVSSSALAFRIVNYIYDMDISTSRAEWIEEAVREDDNSALSHKEVA